MLFYRIQIPAMRLWDRKSFPIDDYKPKGNLQVLAKSGRKFC